MIIDARVAALNEAAVACQELASHYAEDAAAALGQRRVSELNESERLLDAAVTSLGELPKAADPDKELLTQLLDEGRAALSEVTGGLVGQSIQQSLAEREAQLQVVLREVLAESFQPPLSCAVSDILEAAVVESERAVAAL